MGDQTSGPGDEPGHAAQEVTSLGRYVVIRGIGAGAMGAVYVAYDRRRMARRALGVERLAAAIDPQGIVRGRLW